MQKTEQKFTAMILAAGRGKRLGMITQKQPKALIEVNGKPLLYRHLDKLEAAKFDKVIINIAYLGDIIESAVKSHHWNLEIIFSAEKTPLETGGGIANALEKIQANVFSVVNADIVTDYDFNRLKSIMSSLEQLEKYIAHLILVNNPSHNSLGDFPLNPTNKHFKKDRLFTYSGIGIYKREMFEKIEKNKILPLAPLLKIALSNNQLKCEHYGGLWVDVGTRERIDIANNFLRNAEK